MGHLFSVLAVFWDQTYFIPTPVFTEKDLPDQSGKVCYYVSLFLPYVISLLTLTNLRIWD